MWLLSLCSCFWKDCGSTWYSGYKATECCKQNLGYYSRILQVSNAEKSANSGDPVHEAHEDSESNKDSVNNWTEGHLDQESSCVLPMS